MFFEFFESPNIDKVYLKDIGVKTFKKLDTLGVDVYVIDTKILEKIGSANKIKLTLENIKKYATLGH